jgi:hypothetical protein
MTGPYCSKRRVHENGSIALSAEAASARRSAACPPAAATALSCRVLPLLRRAVAFAARATSIAQLQA